MDIYHCPGVLMCLDYWSLLGVYLCFNDLSCKYLNHTIHLRKLYPPDTGIMMPENIPCYRGPLVRYNLPTGPSTCVTLGTTNDSNYAVDPATGPILTSVNMEFSGGD